MLSKNFFVAFAQAAPAQLGVAYSVSGDLNHVIVK
jgi:hypothetical protein